MAKPTRRNLIKVAAAGGVSAALGLTIKPGSEARTIAEPQHGHHKPISGPLAQATVSFGQWSAGSHQVVVYGNGTDPGDIRTDLRLPGPLSIFIDGPRNRIYRGLSPAGVPADLFGTGNPATAIPPHPKSALNP